MLHTHIYSFLEEFRVLLCMIQSGHEEGARVWAGRGRWGWVGDGGSFASPKLILQTWRDMPDVTGITAIMIHQA